ncbi:MAG: hypothetical protein ACFFAE_18250 [Candidatus Hodarchaeota archaeon]
MTVHSKRNRRGRTEIDIATKYFEEEKEKTKVIMEKKKRQIASHSPQKTSYIPKTSIKTQVEKKRKEKQPTHKRSRSTYSSKKIVTNKQKRRTIVKKSRERKKRLKRLRTQYFQRYNVQ